MKRITVSLPDDLESAVEREAARRHVSESEVARRALVAYLGLDANRSLPFAALGNSGQRTTARDLEELIADQWHDARGR